MTVSTGPPGLGTREGRGVLAGVSHMPMSSCHTDLALLSACSKRQRPRRGGQTLPRFCPAPIPVIPTRVLGPVAAAPARCEHGRDAVSPGGDDTCHAPLSHACLVLYPAGLSHRLPWLRESLPTVPWGSLVVPGAGPVLLSSPTDTRLRAHSRPGTSLSDSPPGPCWGGLPALLRRPYSVAPPEGGTNVWASCEQRHLGLSLNSCSRS